MQHSFSDRMGAAEEAEQAEKVEKQEGVVQSEEAEQPEWTEQPECTGQPQKADQLEEAEEAGVAENKEEAEVMREFNVSKCKTGRCIIVGAGDFFGMPFPVADDDYVIAADAGYDNLKALGIRPDLLVGDFDSMHIEGVKGTTGPVKDLDIYEDAEKAEYLGHLKKLEHDGVETRVIDPVKNDPDMMACVRIGMKLGYTGFHMIGGTGKRMDHSIANLQILGFLAKHGLRGYLYNDKQVITAIRNTTVHFPKHMKGYFSALSLTDECRGVTEKGFKYIINDVTLNNLTPTGLSNEFVGTESDITVKEGTLLLIYDY